jgi:hypothetical protein
MYILYLLSHMYENLSSDISESVKYEELIYYLCSLLRIIEKWHALISFLCMTFLFSAVNIIIKDSGTVLKNFYAIPTGFLAPIDCLKIPTQSPDV